MKGLAALLAPKSGTSTAESDPGSALDDASDSDENGASEGANDNFEQAAASCFDALQSGDEKSFSEALQACIEMSR